MSMVLGRNTADAVGYRLEYREVEPEWYVYDITGMVIGYVIGYTDYAWEVEWRGESVSREENEADGVLVLWNCALKEGGY